MLMLDDFFKEIDEFIYPDILKVRSNESEFISDLIEASNHVNKLIGIIAHISIEKSMNDIEKAILMGHMAYICKLYDSFLLLICNNKLEASIIIFRILSEVAIRLKYLTNKIDSQLSQKYIKSSLAYDKKRYEEIKKRVKDNKPTDLEDRMLKNIESRFSDENYKIEDVDYQNDKYWCKDTLQLAHEMKLSTEYEFGYRSGSLAIHASWDFMKQYNLKKEPGSEQYLPDVSSSAARPQIIEAANYLSLSAAIDYLDNFPDGQDKNKLSSALSSSLEWFRLMSQRHEAFSRTLP